MGEKREKGEKGEKVEKGEKNSTTNISNDLPDTIRTKEGFIYDAHTKKAHTKEGFIYAVAEACHSPDSQNSTYLQSLFGLNTALIKLYPDLYTRDPSW